MTEQYYNESVEQAASYNSRLCAEKKMRMPFLDSQTGVAQNHTRLWMPYRYRSPGKFIHIYSYLFISPSLSCLLLVNVMLIMYNWADLTLLPLFNSSLGAIFHCYTLRKGSKMYYNQTQRILLYSMHIFLQVWNPVRSIHILLKDGRWKKGHIKRGRQPNLPELKKRMRVPKVSNLSVNHYFRLNVYFFIICLFLVNRGTRINGD